jgi:hypothetical protein
LKSNSAIFGRFEFRGETSILFFTHFRHLPQEVTSRAGSGRCTMNMIIKDVEDCELDCATDARSVAQLIEVRWSGAAVVSLDGDDR